MPKPTNRDRRVAALICLGAALLVIGLYFTPVVGTLLLRLEGIVRDANTKHGKLLEPRDDIVFLGIDELSLSLSSVSDEEIADSKVLKKMKGSFPWSREVHAEAVRKVLDAGARLVILDLVFPAASLDADGDAALAFALDDYSGKVVIASMFGDQNGVPQYMAPHADILDPKGPDDPRVGYASFWPDPEDNVIRKAQPRITLSELDGKPARPDDRVYRSLAAAAMVQLGKGDQLPPGTAPVLMRFCRPGPDRVNPYKMHPIYEIFVPALWRANYADGKFFKDKIVCIGPAASVLQDFKPTPMGQMLGPQLQLTALTNLLEPEGTLKGYSSIAKFGLLLLAAIATWCATVLPKQLTVALLALLAVFLVYAQTVRWAMDLGQLLPFVPVAMAVLLGGGGVLIKQFLQSVLERRRLQGMLSRMVSRNVAEAIIDNKDSFYATLGGVRRPVTVLFSDVRGFTSMTEDSDPAALVQQLNEYLERMVDAVFAENGTLDKFIGDAVMAVWGNLNVRPPEEEARAAVRSAIAMLAALDKLNEGWKSRGLDPFAIGIGIHHGDAIVGNIGSDEKMEPTVIGDTVNLASRLESLTKYYGCCLLLSGETAAFAAGVLPLRALDRVRVKGKRTPVALFTAIMANQLGGWQAVDGVWSAALAAYSAGEFATAAGMFDRVLAVWPGDGPASLLRKRCVEFATNPPVDWDGVYTLESK